MNTPNPYIHSMRETGGRGDRAYQAFFAIRLLSCPLERQQYGDFQQLAEQRLLEQMDFINALYSLRPPRTFALRYITHPNPKSFSAGKIDLSLLTKCNGRTETAARKAAESTYPELMGLLVGRFPDHAWEVVTSGEDFLSFWEPFDWNAAHVVEIRRREDLVTVETMRPRPGLGRRAKDNAETGGKPDETVYFVHKLIPRPGSMITLLRTLLLHPSSLLWQVTLSPTSLTGKEEEALLQDISCCEERALMPPSRGLSSSRHEVALPQLRARNMAEQLLQQLLRLKDAPYFMSIYLAGPAPIPTTLAEGCGVEITAPVGVPRRSAVGSHPLYNQMGGYDVIVPRNQRELKLARDNAQHLNLRLWGPTLAPNPLRRSRFLVDALEAASAFRLPLAVEEGLPGLFTTAARTRPLPREIAMMNSRPDNSSLFIGENRYLGFSHPITLREKDRRQHLYVVGQTGTGKTTLLKSMILADIAAGNGLAVIDPHGDLFDELLGYIPPHRMEDVVILDPTDMEHPVGLNILECQHPEERYFVVREFKAIMEKLIEDQYGDAGKEFAGPIFWQHTQMNLLLTMSHPEQPGTLLEFYEIFQHNGYWKKWVKPVWTDSKLKSWIDKVLPNIDYIHRLNSTELSLGEYISSKFEDFVFDPKLRLIFGQRRSTINLRRIMDEGKILLVNLAKGELTEANAQFLGMLLMAKLQAAAMQRSTVPADKRRIFYVYVDEFQSLATQNFVLLLSEARKFGIGLVLANQFISQIRNERIVDSIFGNVGTLISFRVGQNDAEHFLEPQFIPYFHRHDLTNLPNWHACVKTTVDGQVVPPFSLHTVLPQQKWEKKIAEKVRHFSRSRYGRPRGIVEREIEESLKFKENEEEELL